MGFITLKDGTVIHASLLNPSVITPSDYKISYIGFSEVENEIIKQREGLDEEFKSMLYNSFKVEI